MQDFDDTALGFLADYIDENRARLLRKANDNRGSFHPSASWRSGDAADCKSRTPTLRTAITDYSAMHLELLATGAERRKQLERFGEAMLDMPVSSIRQRDLVVRLSDWKGATRNRYKAAVVHFWKWCRQREYTDLRPELEAARETSRDAVMTMEELRALYAVAPRRGDWEGFCRLLVLTGQRRGEVAQIGSHSVSGEIWTQPSTKNGTAHVVHLGPKARDIASRVTWTGKTTFSDLKVRWFTDAGLDPAQWRFHDLRRSFATHLVEAGASPDVVDRVLNHQAAATARGIARVYNRATLLDERREVSLAWERMVTCNLPQTSHMR